MEPMDLNNFNLESPLNTILNFPDLYFDTENENESLDELLTYLNAIDEDSKSIDISNNSTDTPEPTQTGQGMPAYTLTFRNERHFAKKAAIERIYDVKFNEQWQGKSLIELHNSLIDMFDDILKQARGSLNDNDLVTVVIRHEQLTNSIVVPLRRIDEINALVILSHIEKVLSSYNELKLNESFESTIGLIDMPKGAGRYNITNPETDAYNKRSMVFIKNIDHMCLARSLAVCFSKAHQVTNRVGLSSGHSYWDRLV